MIYRDVLENADNMTAMLELTKGTRLVPVLVEGDQLTVGYGGT